MLVTLTGRQMVRLVTAAGLVQAVAALENSLGVDFTLESDRYQCRELLAALLQRWFGERDFADVRTFVDGTSVLWSPYQSFGELVEGGKMRAPADGHGRPTWRRATPSARLSDPSRGAGR
jgi:2-methylfumaryl-CoA isomerase